MGFWGFILLAMAACGKDDGAPAAPCETADSPFGLHEVALHDPHEHEHTAASGAGTIRLAPWGSLVWDQLEPQPGQYFWDATDTNVQAAHGLGLHVFATVHPAARSDGTAQGDPVLYPNSLERFLAFLSAAAARYNGDAWAPRIHVIQIGNEVDGGVMWHDTPERYAQLLWASYEAVKSAAPQTCVAIAGPATPPGYYDFYRPVLGELARLGASREQPAFDIFDFHWSGQFGGPDDYDHIELAGQRYELDTYLEDIRADLAAIGHEEVPLYITEMSDYCDDPDGYPPMPEAYQAASLVKRYVYALSLGVRRIYWGQLMEQHMFGGESGYFDHSGLLNNPDNDDQRTHAKLAFYTFTLLAERLGSAAWDEIEPVPDVGTGARAYRVPGRDGAWDQWVAWRDPWGAGAPTDVTLPVGSDPESITLTVMVPDAVDGSALSMADFPTCFPETTLTVEEGVVQFALGDAPVTLRPVP